MLRRTSASLLRRTTPALGGLVEYNEWQLREPLLINYEGWRILDNVPMTTWEVTVEDVGGVGRHLDPIIDDPRLTHQQRVCRLYRWACKEYWQYIQRGHEGRRSNMSTKVIRNRFEKYRYITDPAMCDMMVRTTQKYLADTCYGGPIYYRRNPASPWSNLCGSNPMFHPDNCLTYDHWSGSETFWYDDAKIHRYPAHHPINAGAGEVFDRFGDQDELRAFYQNPVWYGCMVFFLVSMVHFSGVAQTLRQGPGEGSINNPNQVGSAGKYCDVNNKAFEHKLHLAIQAEERAHRANTESSHIKHHWGLIMGTGSYLKSQADMGLTRTFDDVQKWADTKTE